MSKEEQYLPPISVIVPIYNVSNYLKKCVDSILNQTFKDFEVILVDDGSTDDSGNICNEYASKYKDKIKVIHQQNSKGAGGPRNAGIEVAEGKYLLFIDGDDYISPNTIDSAYKAIMLHNADIVVFGMNMVDENKKILKTIIDHQPFNIPLNFKDTPGIILIEPSASNKIYKKTLFIENNIKFPQNTWYEDLATTTRLYTVAARIAFIE